jgi:hypothetical protein
VTTTDPNASYVVTPASSIPGATTIVVTSEDKSQTETYTVNFTATIPTTAAPSPTFDSTDVISIYSDAYTSIATNINPAWGQTTIVSELQIDSNNTLKYANLDYQGMEYPDPTDVSGMDYVHFDYFTSDATALEFFLIAGGENSYNVATELGIKTGQWVGVDIPLSFYSDAGRDLTIAYQFKTVGNGTIYLDNFLFYKIPIDIDDQKVSSFALYPNPAMSSLNVSSNSMIVALEVLNINGQLISTAKPFSNLHTLDISSVSSGIYFIRLISEDSSETLRFIKQ